MSLNEIQQTLKLPFTKGEIISTEELDHKVYQLQKYALSLGMIPISSIISSKMPDENHQILGGGFNLLRDGIPGVHGETGAIMNMGRIPGGYKDLIATSSLSPCPFCQSCLARQMGIKTIRILDDVNYIPDKSGYLEAGITPIIRSYPPIENLFKTWVTNSENRILWNRDIGIPEGKRQAPFTPACKQDWQKYVDRAKRLAQEALDYHEAPIGAVIVDELGEVAGSGFAKIRTENDPSKTAAVSAWRNCGSRNDWAGYTLVLSAGPDHIAYSMFKIFGLGQLVVGSTKSYPGQTEAVSKLIHPRDSRLIPVHVLDDSSVDALLDQWKKDKAEWEIAEYLGTLP